MSGGKREQETRGASTARSGDLRLCHTDATHRLNAGAELVDIKALLGHESIATTQIYTNVGQERMEKVVGRL
ncbi:MAG TPA: tyrosine-type recombinase/integrase [Candidatus Competibacteraceae bacterium]|nr:tyrosine-type recombinase/integrase [Candidatus Competibacteraceae bacterium]